MTKLHILSAICLLIIVCSCSLDVKFSKYVPVSSDGWNLEDTIEFSTDTLRQDGRYGFTCGVRTRRAFPYQNLVLMVEREVYRDSLIVLHKREKVTCPIVTQEGSFTGEGIATKLHETDLKDFIMQTGDSVVVKIYHQMTRQDLPGIVDVGMKMEKR